MSNKIIHTELYSPKTINSKIIHTETFTAKANNTIRRIFNYLRNNWISSQMDWIMSNVSIDVQPNGENIINIQPTYCYDSLYQKNDNDIKKWFGLKIMKIIKSECHYNHIVDCSRNCKKTTMYFKLESDCTENNETTLEEVTIQDLYFIYDLLIGNNINRLWKDAEYVKSMLGKERDPIATELETVRREELNKLNIKHDNDLKILNSEMSDKIKESTKKIEKIFEAKQKKLNANYNKSVAKLNRSMNFMTTTESSTPIII